MADPVLDFNIGTDMLLSLGLDSRVALYRLLYIQLLSETILKDSAERRHVSSSLNFVEDLHTCLAIPYRPLTVL